MMGIKATAYNNPSTRLAIPNYEMVNYETVEELEEYIASPDYKADTDHKGVCFGIQHYVDHDVPDGELSHNYTFDFFFPDQAVGWSAKQFPKAIPT